MRAGGGEVRAGRWGGAGRWGEVGSVGVGAFSNFWLRYPILPE